MSALIEDHSTFSKHGLGSDHRKSGEEVAPMKLERALAALVALVVGSGCGSTNTKNDWLVPLAVCALVAGHHCPPDPLIENRNLDAAREAARSSDTAELESRLENATTVETRIEIFLRLEELGTHEAAFVLARNISLASTCMDGHAIVRLLVDVGRPELIPILERQRDSRLGARAFEAVLHSFEGGPGER